MKDQIVKFWRDEEGATAIEYGLIAGLIAVGIIASVTNIGTQLKGLFDAVVTKLTAIPKT
ncbi:MULTISPECIES: Flp family type IVb pilin [Comamonas]|jgi:pilus assembly protein Flp/PilA|uniref:Flp family type IVb pilin n=1 Tax=Comamonas TaxID=283 RepID=UPI0025DBA860|nr:MULTISPECIES: Flp family type IVb pilin [Comamonas]MDR3067044.1 Flp family type IVb pilin [Comamonas sp.]MEB5963177.1 Flp family type IVb pilin [Comamonas testosteroni]